MQKIRVWTCIKLFPIADYEIEETVQIGYIVKIPFRKKTILGIVIDIIEESKYELKTAEKTEFTLSKKYIDFINNSSYITLHNMQQILNTNLKMFSGKVKEANFEYGCYKPSIFNNEQEIAINEIYHSNPSTFLLWGVTGSGKTEVFFDIIDKIIRQNKQVLILLPEIAITESITSRFFDKFGFNPVLWHSQCKNKTNFMNIYNGNASVVIGARCSIFLPFKNLGLIVVDEEHDSSYKQTTSPNYNARDLAVLRGYIDGISVVLASATPSIETFYHTLNNKYKIVKLTKRYSDASLPKVSFNVSQGLEILSKEILKKTNEELEKNRQIVFFINRRGFGQIVICKKCFNRLNCQKCFNPLSFHYLNKCLLCHKCNASFDHEYCFICDSSYTITNYGLGVEKVYTYLLDKFKGHSVEVISSDICDSPDKIRGFISKMQNKEIDIVVGTQILAKGHNFPGISLVVILGFNNNFINFRGNETIFQTLVQVAGRAGRKDHSSEVILQIDKYTDSKLLDFFQNHNYEGFLAHELLERKKWKLTPFVKIITIKCIDKNETKCIDKLKRMKSNLVLLEQSVVTDPIFVRKKHDYICYQIIFRISREGFQKHNKFLRDIISDEFIVDVDPIGLFD